MTRHAWYSAEINTISNFSGRNARISWGLDSNSQSTGLGARLVAAKPSPLTAVDDFRKRRVPGLLTDHLQFSGCEEDRQKLSASKGESVGKHG